VCSASITTEINSTIPLLVSIKPAFGAAFSSRVKVNGINYTNYLAYNEFNFFMVLMLGSFSHLAYSMTFNVDSKFLTM